MHLIKPISAAKAARPEEVFAAKYDWLLKWALHFSEGDRATAEDLVQDTFVRFIVAHPDVKDPDNAEPLLYTYLKYVHLAHQRRVRRHLQHHLTIVDFDSIQLAVREAPSTDLIDVQDNLRRVTAYLAWRKETAKCASVLILRFVHGYVREEIRKVALISAHAVSNGLLLARDEAKHYLEDATSLRVLHHSAPPEPLPRQVAVPLNQLLQELRSTIFGSCQNPCLPKEELLRHYTRLNPVPIESELLAHIVSCKRCLDLVNDSYQIPRLDRRSPDESERSWRRSKSDPKRKKSGESSAANLVLSRAKDRLRELYDHRPQSISLAVNGHILAARDISSALNRLEVEVHSETRVEFIEVLSEQGLCLLAIPVESTPPMVGPQLRHEVSLGDTCRLELLLKFTSNKLLIEVLYRDDSLLLDPASDQDAQEMIPPITEAGETPASPLAAKGSWWTRVWRRFQRNFTPNMNPLFATAVVLALTSVAFFFLWWGDRTPINSHDFLVQAERWDNGVSAAGQTGVIYQKVRIRTPRQTLERSIYRDVQGKRRAKPQSMNSDLAQLRQQLATAGVSWNEPLSAEDYQQWHDRQQSQLDQVVRSGNDLLTLTTTVASGVVAQESLTIRESDFHPVTRTVTFRNAGTVEIAELNYAVMPWDAVNENLFEPLGGPEPDSSLRPHPSLLPHPPQMVSETEIDEAELDARLALNDLGADKGERLELIRTANGVQVKGIVATSERKYEIESRLRLLAHVIPAIFTFQEFASQPHADSDVTSIKQSSVIAGETPLEKYLVSMGKSREEARRISVELFNDAAVVTQNGKAVGDLVQRFEQSQQLTPEAHHALDQLLTRHKAGILAALDDEDRLVAEIGVPHASGLNPQASVSLKNAAQENIQLCKELISAGPESTRPAEAIVPDLWLSVHRLRSALRQAANSD